MMIEFGTEALIQLIQQHGVLAVVIGMVVEEILVPIPSPIIPMAAGSILIESEALFPAIVEIFFKIALPASIASVISSYFVYSLAYFGGKPALEKYGKYFDISWQEAEQIEEKFFGENDKYFVALFRAIPIVPLSLISGSAGLFRMDWKKYGLWSFIGMMPRNFFLALIGWYARDFLVLANRIDTLSTAVLVAVIGIVGGYILVRKLEHFYRWLLFEYF
jgi:membrane protein DedA with SNARE-associated domain